MRVGPATLLALIWLSLAVPAAGAEAAMPPDGEPAARSSCRAVHTDSHGHAFSVRGVEVRCRSARRVARRYLERRCFGDGARCVGGGYRCRAEYIDFPSPVRCKADNGRAVTFIFDAIGRASSRGTTPGVALNSPPS